MQPSPTGTSAALDKLFAPSSIAVVGASATPGKLGTVMMEAIAAGSDAAVSTFGINPRAGTGSGLHPSLRAATQAHGTAMDLAVLCIPAAATPAALREAAGCGVGAAMICSGGFAETGLAGADLQQELEEIVADTGIRLLGPNTSGFFRPSRAVVSFVPTVEHIAPGTVGVIAASGGMNHALSFLLSENGVGIGLGVGLGNSVDVGAADVLTYAGEDPTITAIALHVESVDDGEALLATVRAVSARKPVVAVVVGRSDVSAFAQSHTGALATSWKTTRALLAEAGAVVVDSERQLVDSLAALSLVRLPASSSPGIGLVTAQAGPGLMVLDDMISAGLDIPPLSGAVQERLAELLPPMTYQGNPVDTGRPGATFADVLRVTASDASIDALAVYALAEPDVIDLADVVRRSGAPSEVPVVLGVGGPASVVEATAATARSAHVPVVTSPSALATAMRALVVDARAQALAADPLGRDSTLAAPPIHLPADEASAKGLLDALGLTTPRRRVCTDRAGAHRALTDLGGPVVAKILDATVIHKTEIGGVHLGIRTPAELDAALDALDAIPAPAYLLEAMSPPGVDLFLGARRDPVFGPIVVAGLGGTATEAIGDIAIRSHRITHAAAAAMLDELQAAALLTGWRGGPELDRVEFARVTVALASFFAEHPELSDIEINPLRLTTDGLIALDAVIIAAGTPAASPEGEQS